MSRSHADAEAQLWERNRKLLYTSFTSITLEWPSLSAQWYPNSSTPTTYDLLLGTSTGHAEPDFVHMVSLAALEGLDPSEKATNMTVDADGGGTEEEAEDENEERKTAPSSLPQGRSRDNSGSHKRQRVTLDLGSSASVGNGVAAATASSTMTRRSNREHSREASLKRSEGILSSVGDGRGTSPVKPKPKSKSKPTAQAIKQSFAHKREVHQIKYMPQHPNLIAARGPQAPIVVYDATKHPNVPLSCVPRPEYTLQGGHTEEGFSMQWHPTVAGLLLSGADDGTVCVWSLEASSSSAVAPVSTTPIGSGAKVLGVAWEPTAANDSLFATVDSLGRLLRWDRRVPDSTSPVTTVQTHQDDANTIAFHGQDGHTVLTGGTDCVVRMWDLRQCGKKSSDASVVAPTATGPAIRSHRRGAAAAAAAAALTRLDQAVHTFMHHTDQVIQVQWNPLVKTSFASASEDSRVCLWDTRGMATDTKDLPTTAPLVFAHEGHEDSVSEFDWHPTDAWKLVSTDQKNTVQVWQVAPQVVQAFEATLTSAL